MYRPNIVYNPQVLMRLRDFIRFNPQGLKRIKYGK